MTTRGTPISGKPPFGLSIVTFNGGIVKILMDGGVMTIVIDYGGQVITLLVLLLVLVSYYKLFFNSL